MKLLIPGRLFWGISKKDLEIASLMYRLDESEFRKTQK